MVHTNICPPIKTFPLRPQREAVIDIASKYNTLPIETGITTDCMVVHVCHSHKPVVHNQYCTRMDEQADDYLVVGLP